MQIDQLTADAHEEWNALAAHQPSFGLLQSWEWGEFKKRLGWEPFRLAVKQDGNLVAAAQMLVKSPVPGMPGLAYIPRGPIGRWLDPEIAEALLPELHHLASSRGACFLRIEPPLLNTPESHERLRHYGFEPSDQTNQPRCTIVLDLNQETNAILMQMRKKTRQYVRKAMREGIAVRYGGDEDLAVFCELIQATSRRKHITYRSRDYYLHAWEVFSQRDQTALLMAYHEDRLLSVRTAYRFGNHAAEFHAGSTEEAATMHPDYLLVWEAIKWAQARGCSTYDLWGIPDAISEMAWDEDDPPKPGRTDGMWGIYRFKRGFGTNIVCYVGAYDYVYKPILHRLITSRFVTEEVLDRATAWLDGM